MCVLPSRTIWYFSGKFDQHLSLYCGSVTPKLLTGPGYWFLWVLWDMISKIYWQLWHSFFKIHLKTQFWSHWNNMEKNGRFSVCLTPVSMHVFAYSTLWRFTVPAYWVGLPLHTDKGKPQFLPVWYWLIYSVKNCQVMENHLTQEE